MSVAYFVWRKSMNYKNADEERIKKNRQAIDEYRKTLTKKTNLESKTYSGKALDRLAKGQYRKVPELKKTEQKQTPKQTQTKTQSYDTSGNLRDRGFYGSTNNAPIDFDYVTKNDPFFNNALKTEYKAKHQSSFGPAINGGVNDNDAYYKRFGMSKDQVLKQYEQYQQGKERQFAESHPILNALKDLPSAPSRAMSGAAAMAAHKLFPYSDLDTFLNNDMFMQETKDVQRRRDYTQGSNKVSDRAKMAANIAGSGGDTLTNIALSTLLGSPMGIGDAVAGVGATIEPAKWVLPVLTGVESYGKNSQETKHELDKQGIDDETATDYANSQGIMWGIVDALTAGQGSKAGEVAKQTGKILPNVLKATGRGAALGGGTQAISEAVNKIILGDKGSFNNDVQRYLSQGMTEQEAGIKAFENALARVGGSAALGGILGGATSLIAGGAGRLIKGKNVTPDTDDLNNIFVGQRRIGQNETLGLPQNDLSSIAQNELPALTGPRQAFPMSGTQGVIPMPGTNGVIELPETGTPVTNSIVNAAENATRNPRLIMPLEGEKRTQALEERKANSQRIRQLNKDIKAQKKVYKNAPKKAKKAEKQKLDALETEKTGLQSTNKRIGRQLDGAIIPMKEILEQNNKDLYDRIYKRNTGLMDNLNYVAKHAGDTAEAKQLAKDIKKSIDDYVETGDINSLYSPETIEKINRLDDLARTTDAEYIGHYKDNALFTDENGNPSIWNALEGASENDLGLTGQIGKLHDSLFDLDLQYFGVEKPKNELAVIPETTSMPVEPVADTEPLSNEPIPTEPIANDGQFTPEEYNALLEGMTRDSGETTTDGQLTPEEVTVLQDVVDGKYDIPENGNETPNVKPSEPTPPDKGYWLRILGDPDFLAEQAQEQGVKPQTLVSYANANLGFSDMPRVTPSVGNVPPNNGMPHVNGTFPGDNQKTSQYYKNTMRRTEENAKMSDEEYHEKFNENEYKYTPYTDAESEKEGYDFISRAGGHDAAVEKILNGKFDDETKPFSHVEVDATHILADRAEKEARELEAQGLDASAKWREADRLHKKLRAELNRSAGAMQANQKWIKKTPRGALDNLVAETNKAIDRKKTKGYTEMVDNLADKVEDAILNNEGKAREDAIKKAFVGRKDKNYKTDKYEQMVLNLVGGKDANKKGSASLAEEAAKLIKKEMGTSTLSRKDERAILNLLEEASRYEQGSRSYKECIAQAMKIFDSNLPSTVGDKVKSLWYDNMLFSIKTMMTRNLGGNLGANAIENLATPLQVGADWLASKVTGQRSRTFSGKAITEGAKGMGKGFKDWFLDVKNGVNTTRSGQESMADALNAAKTTFKPDSDNKILDWINKAGSKYDRVVRKGMEVGDRPIYEAKYAATKAELQAVVDKFGEEGIRKGLPEGDYSLDDVIELIAVNDALEAVLQNNTHMKEGMKAARKFLSETSRSMLGADIDSMIMPFIEVSGNMADRYFQYTPFGIVGNVLRSVYEKKKYGSVNQRRMTGEAGRNVLGGLLGLGAAGLASAGMISGPFSEDPDEKKRQQQNDYQEYALQTPDGSAQKDVSDIPIFGPKLRETKMEIDAFKEGGIPGLLKAMPGAIGSATLDSLFQGLNKVTGGSNKFGKSNNGDNYIGNAAEALKSMPGSLTIPSMVRQTAQFLDPYKRDLGDYGTNEYYVNSFINGLPVLRQLLLDPKINTAGEPVKQFGDDKGLQRFVDAYISPWKTTHPNANISDAQKYADELKAQTNGEVNPQPQVFNASDLKKIKGYDPDKYTHEDLRQFQDSYYKTNNELADSLIGQDWFKNLAPAKQGKYLDLLYSSNKDIHKEDFVRKGMTDAEIEAAKDTLFTGDDKLTKIMRDDDDKHSGMLEYFKNKSGLDTLNEKYDTSMGYDTYVKWNTDADKKAMGGAEAYAKNYHAAKELDMDVDQYIKKQAEYNGGAEKYASDRDTVKSINEKYGSNYDVDDLNKKGVDGLEQRAQNRESALDYGFLNKDGQADTDAYEKAVSIVGNNDASLRAYSDYKKQRFEKNNQRVPYLLDNNSFSAEQKGMIIAGTNPDKFSSKTAKEVYKVGGYEGVWDYYMLKNLFDKDDSGKLNKQEKSELRAFMESDSPYITSIPDDVYYYLGGLKNW